MNFDSLDILRYIFILLVGSVYTCFPLFLSL